MSTGLEPVVRLTDRLGLTAPDRGLRPWWTYTVLGAVMVVICLSLLIDGAARFGLVIAICGVLALVMGALAVVSFRWAGRRK